MFINEETLYGLFAYTINPITGGKIADVNDGKFIELASSEKELKDKIPAYESSWNVNSQGNTFRFYVKNLGKTSWESLDDDVVESFDDDMKFLADDEIEAIDGYEKIINKIDDEHVAKQLKHIQDEEEAHLNYLNKVQDDKSIDYVDHDKIDESVESDFWHLRDLKEPKYGTGNLVIDGDKIRPLTKDELANKFAVSIEHADKGDFKSKEELKDFTKKINAEKIMFYFQPGDNYSGEYSFLISDRDLAKKIKDEYNQDEFAEYDEYGEYHGVVENLEDSDKIKLTDIEPEDLKYVVKDKDIEEDIEKHDELNPLIWNTETNEMLPEVRDKLLDIAQKFIDAVHEDELDLEVEDIVLIGSNANYNYTKDSDLDVHIIASSKPDCNREHLDKIYQAYKSMFNKNYDITIHNIPTEIYVEMDKVNARSGGIFSIKDNKWIKQPQQFEIPDIDYDAFYREFKDWEERYFELIENIETSEEADEFIDDIYEVRKNSIATDGEFAIGNLVFKEIRNRGYLDHLKELKNRLESKEMSL